MFAPMFQGKLFGPMMLFGLTPAVWPPILQGVLFGPMMLALVSVGFHLHGQFVQEDVGGLAAF